MSAGRKWLLSAVVLVTGWSAALAGEPLTLGSGKSVEILAVGPLQSTQGWSGLMLKYRTLLPLSDVPTVRQEVDEIWERFVVDAEHAGYQTAIISANEPETGGVVATNNSYNFVFLQRDGSWRTIESKERAQTTLDPQFVREFVDRLDSAFEHNEMNAVLLYMANDWEITIVNPKEGPAPQTLDRMKFVTVSRATFAAATNRQHHREILDISVAAGGAEAQVVSRETEALTVNERQIAGVERSTDVFALRDDVMLWLKSTSVVESQTETRSN